MIYINEIYYINNKFYNSNKINLVEAAKDCEG